MARLRKIRKTNPVSLIICEDTKSSKHYLTGFSQYYGLGLTVESAYGTSAKNVVETAEQRKKHFNKHDIPFDIIGCVFDKDDDAIDKITSSIEKCKKQKFLYGYSNPCYEYWLLLHYKKTDMAFTSAAECCEKCLTEYNAKYNTSLTIKDLKAKTHIFNNEDYLTAQKNATALGLTDINNTYTNMHEFLAELLAERGK
ncbi:MAG: RloB family protein [Alphaproteobacteria bacterium]